MSGEKKETGGGRPGQVTDEAIFKATKEIVVKFIEVGRLTPATFTETFDRVYQTIRRSVRAE